MENVPEPTSAELEYMIKMRPKNAEVLDIGYKDGHIYTKFSPYESVNVLDIGIMLASAARVISESFRDMLNLPQSELEQIQVAITEVFNNDMKYGTMGEEENTKLM